MNVSLEERLVQLARKRITDQLDELYRNLGDPSRIKADPAATGHECSKYIWQIFGLKAALVHIQDANDELNGRSRKKD